MWADEKYTQKLNPKTKLTDKDMLKIQQKILNGVSMKEIATEFNVVPGTILYRIRNNPTKLFSEEEIKEMRNTFFVLTEKDVSVIRDRMLKGESVSSICKDYNVVISVLYDIKKGRIWKSVVSDEDVRKMNEVMPIKKQKYLSEEFIIEIKPLLLDMDIKGVEIEREYNLTSGTVSKIRRGERWAKLFTEEEIYIMKNKIKK